MMRWSIPALILNPGLAMAHLAAEHGAQADHVHGLWENSYLLLAIGAVLAIVLGRSALVARRKD
ncbi:MAG: hypothetical protein FJX46_09905 [Alphaproteobacteria bacterium]|nr:hypothetical protein [Alphaproteobacteria bacterium]